MSGQPAVRILVVEDSAGVARSLRLGLGLYGDGMYQAEACGSGEEALKRLAEAHFDLLISDLRLPGIDGLTLIERGRQLNPGMRAILITAFGSPELEERAQQQANAYLAKPFTLQDILRSVERVLMEPMPSPPPAAAPARPLKLEQRQAVHLTVLACDLDGTLAANGKVRASAWEALRAARSSGLVLVLVTGRTLDSFLPTGPYEELFEAIVAENGAVVYLPRRDVVMLPFGRLPEAVLHRLHLLHIPVEWGIAIAATVVPHDETLLWVLRDARASVTVEYNRNAIMLLPTGASKGSGLIYALDELGYSAHNTVACGDAENDRSMFEIAELAVVVGRPDPSLRDMADVALELPAGEAVEVLLRDLTRGTVAGREPRPERSLLLGHRASGSPVRIDPFALVEANIGILGSSGSGKSWLAGLVAEELLKQRYQVCIIDPEGDYRTLGASPRTLLLGGPGNPLPPVADVLNVVEWNAVSLVLDLSTYTMDERLEFLDDFLRAMRDLRARRGRPHYFFLDEVQSFCPWDNSGLTEQVLDAMRWGGFSLISFRPSQVSMTLLDQLNHLLLTRVGYQEEIETLRPWLARYEMGGEILHQLPTLPVGQAFLCTGTAALELAGTAPVVRFRVSGRATPHVRHLHKYLRAPLPAHRRFYFTGPQGGTVATAANLWEFREQISRVPVATLRQHLERGDFARWLGDVLHDEELAHRVASAGARQLEGEALRKALVEVVGERYDELDAVL
jgi:hydroxymethylpyrimidine pyrophosphatase-like HAD family hydrolase/CheY-like chemotaxis protein